MSALLTARLSSAASLNINSAVVPVVHYPARLLARLACVDFVMCLAAFYAAAWILEQTLHVVPDARTLVASMTIGSALWIAIFARAGFYRESLYRRWWDELYWITGAALLGVVPQLLIFSLVPQLVGSRSILIAGVPLMILTVTIARLAVRHAWQYYGQLDCRVAVVGDAQRVRDTTNVLRQSRDLAVLGLAVPRRDLNTPATAASDWFARARAWHADRILFTELPPPVAIPGIALAAGEHQIQVSFAAPHVLDDLFKFGFDFVGRQGVIVPAVPRARRRLGAALKRAFDVTFALAGLLVFGIPMILAALAVLLESGRPVFLRQQRIGKDGKPFEMLKFRSMRLDAEERSGAVWATSNDCRTTAVGRILRRTSVDELPQIFNVLLGDMSIVGPRPERPVFVERFRRELPRYDERHNVLPGITGWSHIYMDRCVDSSAIECRLEHDLFYIEHWSVLMDLVIVCKTACEFLFHRVAA